MVHFIGLGIGGIGVLAIFTGVVLQKWEVAAGGVLLAVIGYLLT